ncbi:MAG: energy transducer TonB [Candidatus Eisenbacteria bacterium]
MTHGIQGYFHERARAARRVSLMTAALSVTALALLVLMGAWPASRTPLISPEYFGYEGPEQYRRRIETEQQRGGAGPLTQLGELLIASARRGGHRGASSTHPHAEPVPHARMTGPGSADVDVTPRATTRHANLPEVKSEDLVFVQKVAAAYPPMLFERDVEGWVLLEVVVDTLGNVGDIEIRRSSGEPLFEESASQAALQCRFRPYMHNGRVSAVVTRLRFTFSIAHVSE